MVNYMRLIAFLFLIFLSLHSYVVFAQDPPSSGGSPQPICNALGVEQWVNATGLTLTTQQCLSQPQSHNTVVDSVPNPPVWLVRCDRQCTCPEGSTWNQTADSSGCVEDEEEECEFGEVYDPVTGTVSCNDGDGSESSAAQSSSSCVVPGDFNGDCIPDDQQGSSAPSSTPASAAASSVANSTSGGDDNGGNNGGGGGDNNNGGSNGGAGSASSAASASSQSGGAASSAASSGKGQCDPTAKNYLACIGSEKMNGDSTDWEPVSANGNWLPVNENSPCVNKYQDSSGQWWCAAPSTNTPSSASGACDPTSTNYASCINSGATSSSGSSGGASSEDAEGLSNTGDELIDGLQQDIDSELTDFEQAYTDDIDAFKRDGVPFDDEPSAIKSVLISFLPVSTSCNPPKLEFFGNTYDLDCYYFDVFKQALGWFLAIITAFQIWQMAIRPVER